MNTDTSHDPWYKTRKSRVGTLILVFFVSLVLPGVLVGFLVGQHAHEDQYDTTAYEEGFRDGSAEAEEEGYYMGKHDGEHVRAGFWLGTTGWLYKTMITLALLGLVTFIGGGLWLFITTDRPGA